MEEVTEVEDPVTLSIDQHRSWVASTDKAILNNGLVPILMISCVCGQILVTTVAGITEDEIYEAYGRHVDDVIDAMRVVDEDEIGDEVDDFVLVDVD